MQSGMEDTYVKVAIGYQNPESIHPMIDHVTESTNGVLVYQEQIMKSAQILAGFTFAEADNIRKAIGKGRREDAQNRWRVRATRD
jgi:DNA polymerase-3 subunit alpha